MASDSRTVGITAGSTFDIDIEREVFAGMDVELRPVDIESTADLKAALADVDAVIDRLLAAPYTADVIDALDRCRIIARCGIGVDAIDVEHATRHGVYVTNVPTYCQDEVSEHTLALILALQRNLVDYDSTLKDGVWRQNVDDEGVHRLRGQTLGLVGFGAISQLVAEKALAFGMDIVATDPYVAAEPMADAGVEKASFEEVLEIADIVSLHTPLTDETAGMMDADAFARMKDSAFLVNVARGRLVDEDALLISLRSGDIAGAGLDVYEHEPSSQENDAPAFENPLADRDDVVLTPHVAWFSKEANDERRYTAARDVRRVFEGNTPEHAANEPR